MDEKKNRIETLIKSALEIKESEERARKLRNVVGILSFEAIRAGDAWYLDEALKTAKLVEIEASKAYVDIIKAMAKIGVNKKNDETLKEALKIADSIDNNLDLSVALHEIVVAFAKLGHDSLSLMEKIPLNTYRSSALRNISKLLTGSNPSKAVELLEMAIAEIENIGIESVYLINAYCDTAALLSIFNDGRSYSFLKRATALAENVVDEFEKSAVLLKIAETEIDIGTKKKDEKLLKEAVRISEGITREYYKTMAMDAVQSAVI